jgi:hypothetical protein
VADDGAGRRRPWLVDTFPHIDTVPVFTNSLLSCA